MADTAFESDPEFLATVRLGLTMGIGPRIRRALLERFGSARAVFEATADDLYAVRGVGPKLAERLIAARVRVDVDGELARCRDQGVHVLVESDPRYPGPLHEVHDPPGVLFVRGQWKPEDALSVGIVGTRHASRYGLRQAERLAGSLARAGLTITSGLARGIDAAAHRGALDAGGRTIAVLGSGVLNIYPPEHDKLAEQIERQGAVISESPPMFEPLAGSFPQRNRLISGLSLGVIVIEAGERSGALITARHAMEQGREVFAVPGSVESRTSRGCHRLIRDGAKLVEGPDDVLEELGPLFEPAQRDDGPAVHHPAELQLNDIEQRVLAAIPTEPTSMDTVVAQSGLPVPQVLSTVSVLEMRRLVRRLSGTMVTRR